MPGDTALSIQPVKRRLVLFFPGFEPLGPEAHRGRFAHAAQKTGPHYATQLDCGPLRQRPSGLSGFAVNTLGKGWETASDIVIFDWSAILTGYEHRSFPARLVSGLMALISMIASGTLGRYLSVSWRYGFFFFYPFLLLIACALGGWLASAIIGTWLQGALLRWLSGLVVAFALAIMAARKAHLLLMMDDWAFAASLANGSDPAIEAMRASLKAALTCELQNSGHDEVLAVGHSLGCVFAVDCLASADLSGNPQPAMMTAGSSLMKIALHPAGGWLVEGIRRLTTANIKWLDVQSLTDVISFFRSNPATTVGITSGLVPKTLAIRFKSMLSAQAYKRGKYNLFRTHRQFVLAAGRRYPYSMHMIACGPVPFETVWSGGGLPLSSGLFGQDAGADQ